MFLKYTPLYIHFIAKSKAYKHYYAYSTICKHPNRQVQEASQRALDLVVAPGNEEDHEKRN